MQDMFTQRLQRGTTLIKKVISRLTHLMTTMTNERGSFYQRTRRSRLGAYVKAEGDEGLERRLSEERDAGVR
jgi:hypothetical protein